MTDISYSELLELIETQRAFLLIDVREQAELKYGVLPGAISIPLAEFKKKVNELPKDKPLILYCRSGNRSAFATAWAKKAGYDARNYRGSVLEWSKHDSNVKAY